VTFVSCGLYAHVEARVLQALLSPYTIATGTPKDISDKCDLTLRSDFGTSSPSESSVTGAGQSRKDASALMRRKKSHYCRQIIRPRETGLGTPELSYTKSRLCIGTWNVLSLVSDSSKLMQLSNNIDAYGLDVLGITETHMPGTGEQVLENGSLFIHSGRADGIKRQGVGLTLSKKVKKSLISYSPYSERFMTARLHTRQINITVMVCYAPTNDAKDEVKDEFFQQMYDILAEQPRHDIKLVIGDFNAKLTTDYDSWPGVISKHSLHDTATDNGTRLLDFCTFNQLTIGGTLFEHKNIHKGTWHSRDGRTVNQIDHICISRKFNHSLLDVRSHRGADIGSDHYLVRGYLQVKLQSVEKQAKSCVPVPDIGRLRDKSRVPEYNKALHSHFMAAPLAEKTLEESWSMFKDGVGTVSMDVLGPRGKRKRENHFSTETKKLLEERGKVKRRDPMADANRSEYSRLNKLVKKQCKIDDNKWAGRVADELEEAASRGQQQEVWAKIKVLSKKPSNTCKAVKDLSGKPIAEPAAQRLRWQEHFSDLLNNASDELDLADLDSFEKEPSFDYLSEEDGPPTMFEIESALKRLKNNKSPGVDNISNEQLKYGMDGLKDQLCVIFRKVWEEEAIPEDWSKGIIVIVPKKGDTSVCKNNRGITLRSTASKLFQMIFLQRLNTGLEHLLRDNQCGFRRNRSCIDQLFALRTIIHKTLEYNLPLCINFVDYRAAFDSIRRDFIWKAFDHYGLPQKYIRIMQAFFAATTSAVRFNGELSGWFEVKTGTGQGDIQGPPIFNVGINWCTAMAESSKVVSKGLPLQRESIQPQPVRPSRKAKKVPVAKPGVHVMDVDYADDQALLDGTKEGLQETTDLLGKFCEYSGLFINVDKTKSMAVSRSSSQRPFTKESTLDIKVYGKEVEQVSEFKYLGALLSADGCLDKEISARLQKATGAFNSLYPVWNNRNIWTNTKMRIYKAAVLTILCYGCETWNTTVSQMRRLEAFHQRSMRKILKIRWFHKVKNVEVLRRAKVGCLEDHIASMRLRWFGHVARMPEERLPHYLQSWAPEHGKRSQGGQRKTLETVVIADAKRFTGKANITFSKLQSLATDRSDWRQLVTSKRDINLGAGYSTG